MSKLGNIRERMLASAPSNDPYETHGNVSTETLRDPRFLRALREEYQSRGDTFENDEDLIRQFSADRSWADGTNTLYSVIDAGRAMSASPAARERQRYLQETWNNMPYFWQEGGRGWEGFRDNAAAVVTDPINLLGLPVKGAALATRGALAAGKSGLMAGIKQGAKEGLVKEGLISGVAEGAINAATQTRDVALGLQDEFSTGQLAGSIGVGAGIGGVAGAVVGGGAGAYAARGAQRQFDELTGPLNYPTETAGSMPQPQVEEVIANQTAYVPETPPALPAEDVPVLTPQEKLTLEMEAKANDISEAVEAMHGQIVEMRASGVDVTEQQQAINQLSRLRQFPSRFAKEADEINKLEASSDLAKQAEAKKRRAAFNLERQDFDLALRSNDVEQIAATVARLEAPLETRLLTYQPREDGVTAAVDQPINLGQETGEAARGDGIVAQSPNVTQPDIGEAPTEQVVQPTAQVTPEAQAPSPEAAQPEEIIVPPNLGKFRGQLLAEGIDPETIRGTGKNGKIVRKDIIAATRAAAEPSEYARGVQADLDSLFQQAQALNVDDEMLGDFIRFMANDGAIKSKPADITALFERLMNVDQNFRTSSQIIDKPTTTEEKRIRRLAKVMRSRDPELAAEDADMLARMEVMAQRADTTPSTQPRTEAGEKIEPRTFARNNERLGTGAAVERANLYTSAGRNPTTGRLSELLKRGLATSKVPKEEIETYYQQFTKGAYADRTVTTTGLGPGEQAYQGKMTFDREGAFVQAKNNARKNIEIVKAKDKATADYGRFSEAASRYGIGSGRAIRTMFDKVKAFYDPTTKRMVVSVKQLAEAFAPQFREQTNARGTRNAASMEDVESIMRSLTTAIRSADVASRDMAPEVVPYVTTHKERIYSDARTGTIIEVPKGTEVWVDARTGRTYKSMDQALYARGDLKKEDPRAKALEGEDPADAPPEGGINELLRNMRGADPQAVLRELRKFQGKADAPPPNSNEPAPVLDGKLLILRDKANPKRFRLLSPKQADQGKTAKDILGKENPDNWEARYIERDQFSWDSRTHARLWEGATPTEAPVDELAGAPTTTGNAVANERPPMDYVEFSQLQLTDITPDELRALNHGLSHVGSQKSYPDISPQQATGRLLAAAIHGLEHSRTIKLPADRNIFDRLANDIETLYQVQARVAPQGYVRPAASRAESIENLRDVLSKYDSKTQLDAYRMIERLGGGDRAPSFGRDSSWSLETDYSPASSGQQIITVPETDPRASVPPLAKIYHETMHWAWHNILTPQDRMDFIRHLRSTAYDEQGKLRMADVDERSSFVVENGQGYGANNSTDSFGEVFADRGSQWAMRHRASPIQREDAFWQRMARYAKALFERYIYGRPIEPELEKLFSKVLPDDARLQLQQGRAAPETRFGQAIERRYRELGMLRKDMEEALRSGSEARIIEAARQLRDHLSSVSISRGTAQALANRQGEKVRTSGPFSPYNAMVRRIRQRASDISEVLTGRGFPEDYIEGKIDLDPDMMDGASISARSPEEIAIYIGDIYDHGHAPAFHGGKGYSPVGYVPDGDVESTPIFRLLDDMEMTLESAFMRVENNPMARRLDGTRPEATPEGEPAVRRAKAKAKRFKAREKKVEEEAVQVAKTEPNKRPTQAAKKGTPDVDQANAGSLRDLSRKQLLAQFERHKGTPRGHQIAQEILRKAKTEPLPTQAVDVPREIMQARLPDLERMLATALGEGGAKNKTVANQIIYEMQRRGHRARLKAGSSDVVGAVKNEIADNEGVATADGIPPNARAVVREILSYTTHRDPEVQVTLRTMTYRMLNLMGRTTKSTLDNVNVLSIEEVARLAGADPNTVSGYGVFMDFRGPEFQKLRTDLRRMAVGLNKERSSPLAVIHEIGHVVARGVLKDEDRARIYDLYQSTDDTLKRQVEKEYRQAYAHMELNPNQFNQVLAEEWFAEGMARYLAERATKREAFAILDEGNLDTIELRGAFDTLVDRVTEYIAYIVNGLIGRNDIKQEFRRLTLFGDMFEGRSQTPIRDAYANRNGVPASLAADYAEETIRHAPKAKYERIMDYVRGPGLEGGKPVVWYHGTPNGHRLRKDMAPDAVLEPSRSGWDGPGIYLTASPRVAQNTYADRATPSAIMRMVDERQAWDLEVERITEELDYIRYTLGTARRQHDEIVMNMGGDEVSDFLARQDADVVAAKIADLANTEQALMSELDARGIGTNPYVAPVYVRVENTANFSKQAKYFANDPFVRAFMEKAYDLELASRETIDEVMSTLDPETPMTGPRLQRLLSSTITDNDQHMVTHRILRELGYDGIRTNHSNMVADEDVLGEMISHDVLVVFDSKNAKHVDADLFDADDARLYYREVGAAAVNPSGPLLRNIALGRDLSETSASQIAETLEIGEVSSPLIDAVTNIYKGRALTAKDEVAVRKVSAGMGLLATQSKKMRHIGANWIADWYQPHFADIQQTFMKKWSPIERLLRQLPDNDNRAKRWMKRSTGVTRNLAARQPKSHDNIVRALRYGDDGKLTAQEKSVFAAVRDMFAREYEDMRAAGIFVGKRKNYFPQVWNPDAIRKNEGVFLEQMSNYYVVERANRGEDAKKDDAAKFARKMYDKLSNEGEDTVHFPVDAQSSASPGDSIDFNRLIELDKFPGMIEALEPFLEKNLEAIVNRYLDASVRRTKMTQKFGVNGQGVKDYMLVMQEGESGIARLLSTNRVIEKDIWHRNLSGEMETMVLRDVTYMPFNGQDPTATREFVSGLVQVFNEKGAPAARQVLKDIGPRTADSTIPLAYERRVDAILGALSDYKGKPANVASKEYDMLVNAMAAANKRPLADSQFGGMAMVHATRHLRNFNAITLLSFTTLTSLSDLVMPALRSGNLGAWAKGLAHMAGDPEYAELIRNTGVAIENQLHEHLAGLHGGSTSRLANAFFSATGLTPYTELTRRMAGVTGHESFKSMQRQAFKHYRDGLPPQQQPEKYKIAHRFLHKYGLGDYLPAGPKKNVSLSDNNLLKDDDGVRAAVIRFANESIFMPNADDIPLWAQTPIGATIFQLKSYPLMLGRMGKEVVLDDLNQFIRTGEMEYLRRPMYFASLGPAFGMGALAAKDIVQSRGGEDNRSPELRKRNILQSLGYDAEVHGNEDDFLGWYFEGMVMMGGFGLLLELMHDVSAQVDNGAWGKVRIASTIGGPSVGTAFSTIDVLAGITDTNADSNAKERTGLREAVRRVPVVGGIAGVREAIVDAGAGEVADRNSGFSSF